MINPSYEGNSVLNNSFNGVNSKKKKKIKFTKMHYIFLSFSIIVNIVHDNQKTPRNIKRDVFCLYCVVSVAVFSEYHLIKYEEIRAPFAASFLGSCGRVPVITK